MTAPTYTVTVAADKAGTRLDKLLAEALPELSRNRLQALIADGYVASPEHGPLRDASRRGRSGEIFVVTLPPPSPPTALPQPIPLAVIYEDEHLIVVDKPAGLVVHPGAGVAEGTLVNALLAHCGGHLSSIGAPLRPGIVHRLDKDTSGLIVAAKTDAAHAMLAWQFAEHTVERAYIAAVWGHPVPAAGRISKAIARSIRDRRRMTAVDAGGKTAITYYRSLRSLGRQASLVECRLATGRTHQVRVHLAAIGCPVVGDPVYRARRWRAEWIVPPALPDSFRRQALHAYLMGFRHPQGGRWMRFVAERPKLFRDLVRFLEGL